MTNLQVITMNKEELNVLLWNVDMIAPSAFTGNIRRLIDKRNYQLLS